MVEIEKLYLVKGKKLLANILFYIHLLKFGNKKLLKLNKLTFSLTLFCFWYCLKLL